MKPYILNIESSTTNCSVAISRGDDICAFMEKDEANFTHAENLHVMIQGVLKTASLNIDALDAIAVSAGPGSYTGLRIGVSAAKGLCLALGKPLIAVPTLEALAHAVRAKEGYIIPILDARSMGVYAEVYDNTYSIEQKTIRICVDEHMFSEYWKKSSCIIVGTGVEKCQAAINAPNTVFKVCSPSSKYMLKITLLRFLANRFEDVFNFDPLYLKDFV